LVDDEFLQEFDDPERLLSDRTSALYQLAQQTGKAEANNLLNIARVVSCHGNCCHLLLIYCFIVIIAYFFYRRERIDGG
jgi:hypothetical protein